MTTALFKSIKKKKKKKPEEKQPYLLAEDLWEESTYVWESPIYTILYHIPSISNKLLKYLQGRKTIYPDFFS